MEKDPATILEDAADLLLIHGRCRGTGVDADGRMCVRGALIAANGGDPSQVMGGGNLPGVRELERFLALHPELHASGYIDTDSDPDNWRRILSSGRWPSWLWNDRLKDDFEVIDTLRLAAKDLRNEATA